MTKKLFTAKQGQYLAFIFYYTKIHGFAPAEFEKYFGVSPPSVHQMVLTLEAKGFIERVPGKGRSIRLLIPRETLPDLEIGLVHVQQPTQLLSSRRFPARDVAGKLILIEYLPDGRKKSR